tara:strand:- start:199 stop:627 length:429 start_codon:yes stop_codon:yes gene_type:complete
MNIKNGQKVNVHYVGTLKDGTEFDSSRKRGNPLSFTLGSGQILPAFEKAVQTMDIGERKTFSLTATEAYGEVLAEAIQSVPKTSFSDQVKLEVGEMVSGQTPNGNPIQAKISSVEEETITLDFNHPLAGKDLSFEVELLSIE